MLRFVVCVWRVEREESFDAVDCCRETFTFSEPSGLFGVVRAGESRAGRIDE